MYKLKNQKNIYLVSAKVPFKLKPDRFEVFNLVFDPGAAYTLLNTNKMDILGYSASTPEAKISRLDGAGGDSVGYQIEIPIFECLGQKITDFSIACHDLNSRIGVDGLLGMNFFKHFRMDIDFSKGLIHKIDRLI